MTRMLHEICDLFPSFIGCWWHLMPPWQRACTSLGLSCGGLAFVISAIHFLRHTRHGLVRSIRLNILLIVFMVPLYSINVMASLVNARSILDVPKLLTIGRDFYEVVVICAFMELILNALDGPDNIVTEFCKSMQSPSTPFLKCIPTPFGTGRRYVSEVLAGIMQFTVVMVMVTILGISAWACTIFPAISPLSVQSLNTCTIVAEGLKSASIGFAMYCITIFYFEIERNDGLREKFQRIQWAEAKFLCIKGIIGFTIFQNFIFKNLIKMHFFDGWELTGAGRAHPVTNEEVGTSVQSFLLCCEMLFFAILHVVAYPVAEFDDQRWQGVPERKIGPLHMWKDMLQLKRKYLKQRNMERRLKSGECFLMSFSDQEIRDAFDAFKVTDQNGNEVVPVATFNYMQELATRAGRADTDGDGSLTQTEFVGLFQEEQARYSQSLDGTSFGSAGGPRQPLLAA